MSTRQLRKVFGDNSLPAPDDSDEDYEPLYTKKASVFSYAGLELEASNSEKEPSDVENNDLEEQQQESEPSVSVSNKKKNNKKKRKKKTKKEQEAVDDEIERSVQEVNQLLGSPSKDTPNSSEEKVTYSVMSVQSKHLNYNYENKIKFGVVTEDNEGKKKRPRKGFVAAQFKKAIIVPIEKYADMFKRVGLSMSLDKVDNGVSYFLYNHSEEYQRQQYHFLSIPLQQLASTSILLNNYLAAAQTYFHVEMLLTCADAFFEAEEYTAGRELIEQIVGYLQYVAHPSFNVADSKTRLLYMYTENRPFHVALLKFLYLLTNIACHRTALELAKVLLNLDPSDPLAVILIIDTIALRAREHEWLIEAIDLWNKERAALYLHNIKYSNALAHYHVLRKKKEDIGPATELLEEAIIHFPKVVLDILTCANQKVVENLKAHPFFEKYSSSRPIMEQLYLVYAKFVWPKWREPEVLDWLIETVVKFVDRYNNSTELPERAESAKNVRYSLFNNSIPSPVHRHLCVIRAMGNLLCEHPIQVRELYRVSDPLPPLDSINRYGYGSGLQQAVPRSRSHIYDILATLYPGYNPNRNQGDHE